MKKLLCSLALLGALAPALAQAQVKIDMGRITCGEFLAMDPDEGREFAAWMSGWFAQKQGRTQIDLVVFQKNVDIVRDWCGSHKTESVMTGLTLATEKKK